MLTRSEKLKRKREWQNVWNVNHPNECRERAKKSYLKHREKRLLDRKKYYLTHKEQFVEYRKKNHEQISMREKSYYRANRERLLLQDKLQHAIYYKKHRKQIIEK